MFFYLFFSVNVFSEGNGVGKVGHCSLCLDICCHSSGKGTGFSEDQRRTWNATSYHLRYDQLLSLKINYFHKGLFHFGLSITLHNEYYYCPYLQRENWRVETLGVLTTVREEVYNRTKGEIKWLSQRNSLLDHITLLII